MPTYDGHGTAWVEPMLASPTQRRFSDPGWLFERKLDGVRTLAIHDADGPRLVSRNRNDVTASYPEITAALQAVLSGGPADAVLDGEVVAFDGDRTSFSRLQQRIHLSGARRIAATGVPVFYYVFDLLRWDGHDATRVPLVERKALLRDAVAWRDPLRYGEHVTGAGEDLFERACASGWEGVIAKRATSRYTSGRSRDWLKLKCILEQDLVVGGFTEPTGGRAGLGALLVGYHADGALRYGGKVGTGFTHAVLSELRETLGGIEIASPPFADPPRERGAHWVHPRLVVSVTFGEWTEAGRLRHPSYRGLRTDKDPRDVVRET
jgi:DNA ligase D-like protein (predicted ligase)